MKNDLVININLATQNENKSLIGKSIARQLSLNANAMINQSINNSFKQQPEIRAYKRRFLMIILALLLCTTNAYQWLQFSAITDKLTLFYGISNLQVNLLSIIYFCVYVTCIIPITKLIERKGLRFSIIFGASLNFLGTLIKCASVNQEYGFQIALFGQFFSGLACLLIFNIPPEIASTWFKSEEVSRVVSLEVCSCFIGNAIAFFIPTMVVGNLINIKDIAAGFYELYFGAMIITGLILITTILFFEERPLHPPSLSQFYRLSAIKNCKFRETTSILDLLKNRNLVIFIIYSSLNAGVYDAFTTLLNQMILIEFPNDFSKVGTIGIIFILSGMVGSLFCGYLLDKLHKYKEISIIFYGFSIFFLVLFMFKLHFSSTKMINTKFDELVNGQTISNNVLLHIYAICLGFFLIGYWTIRFDFGTELAYPHPASTVCGLTAGCCDIAGVSITLITSKVVDNYGTLASNLVLVVLLAAGMCLLVTIKPEYKRQQANANKVLINHNSNINNNNNNQINPSYGSLNESKWLLADHQLPKASLTQVSSCRSEYSNMCFQFPASNVMLTN